MKSLYNRVVKGIFPNIPKHYSKDLQNAISFLLTVDPTMRPSSEELTKMQWFEKRHIDIQVDDESDDSDDVLLGTIKLPKNLRQLTERLPSSQYERRSKHSKITKL